MADPPHDRAMEAARAAALRAPFCRDPEQDALDTATVATAAYREALLADPESVRRAGDVLLAGGHEPSDREVRAALAAALGGRDG